jgi:AraC-like DNA-binding protein
LIDLLAAPQDIPILAPTIQQEILYRLLVGDQGTCLRQIASAGSQSHQIAQAIEWLKRHYTRPLREARRLMLTESLDATTAALQVGYGSPSQFSREYSREFGAPPLRDITYLRQMAG